jgi:hypothetical protein
MLSKNKWATSGFQPFLISLQNLTATFFKSDSQVFRVENNLYAGCQTPQPVRAFGRQRGLHTHRYRHLGRFKGHGQSATGRLRAVTVKPLPGQGRAILLCLIHGQDQIKPYMVDEASIKI